MSGKPSLKELGYRFNQKGELRTINDNTPFVFTNQTDYERIGDAMTMELYGMLESVCGLRKIEVPVKVEDKNGATVDFPGFVFASPEFLEKSTVLLIIHGSGAVRPGQWSRRLILNESLEVGSQIPYIRRALVNDWGVVVCSTNTDEEFRDYPRHHLCSVYEQLLKDSTIQRFFVVAHSRGGPDIAHTLSHFKNENRFELVCLTDSIANCSQQLLLLRIFLSHIPVCIRFMLEQRSTKDPLIQHLIVFFMCWSNGRGRIACQSYSLKLLV
ncbi:hypothetical protein Aduo_009699 [Ancylostoma duodenale]